MSYATGSFEQKNWDEKTYQEIDGGGKLTRASVTQSFHGDIQGDGVVEYVMVYRSDGTADFLGLQYIEGSVGGRSGSFVLQTIGTFDGQVAQGTWAVVPGSGTGDLSRLQGQGGFSAPHGPKADYNLKYDF